MENQILLPRWDSFDSTQYDAFRGDAAETAFVAAQTNYVYETASRQYRRLEWRDFLRVDGSIPPEIDTYILRRVDGFAQGPVPFQFRGGASQRAEVKQFEKTGRQYEFITGHSVYYREIQRAARFGLPLDSWRVDQLNLATELFLDGVMCTGDTWGLGLTGIAKLPDVALVGSLTGTWSGATIPQIVADLWKIYYSVINASLGIAKTTDIILAQSTMQAITAKQSATTDKTALEIFNLALAGAGLERPTIRSWSKLNLANATNNGPRAIAYDRTNPLGPRALLSQELVNAGPPRLIQGGYEQDMTLVTGGVICPFPTAVAYADGL